MNLPKLEICFCAAGLAMILLLKFAVMDSLFRHERLWREFSMLAVLSERQHMYRMSVGFFKAAIRESEQVGRNNIRVAFSLADYARLLYRAKKYSEALNALDKATAILQILEKQHPEGLQADLTKGEFIRIELLRAQIFRDTKDSEACRMAGLQVLKVFSQTNPGNPDLIDVIRAKGAFALFCQEYCKSTPSPGEIQQLLAQTQLCRRFKQLPASAALEMAENFEAILAASPALSPKDREEQLKLFVSCLPTNDQSTEAGAK